LLTELKKDFRYKLAQLSKKITGISIKISKRFLMPFNRVLRAWQDNFNITDMNKRWAKARLLTYPWHHIWIKMYKSQFKKEHEPDLIQDTEGLQIIGGNTGSGKSTLLFDVMEVDRLRTGKPWYVNTDIEKPRFDASVSAMVRYHRYIPFDEVFNNFLMQVRLNPILFSGYGIDEIHRIFDYRQNSTTAYASKFVPFRDYAVVVRKHIKKLIGLTQMDRLDIQLMYLVKLWHKPRIDIGFDYEDWMWETGLFRFKVKGWYIDTYAVDTSNPSNMLHLVKEGWYRKATADFDYFDTYAYSDAYDHIPLDLGGKITQ